MEAGLFHDFRNSWVEELKRALNGGVLPDDHYAMTERQAAGSDAEAPAVAGPSGPVLAGPKVRVSAESTTAFYRRKQATIAVRHVSDDRVVAVIEVVSPGNKASRHGIEALVRKAAELLDRGIHLLILDVLPPGPCDPLGIHGAIWEYIEGSEPPAPARPLTLAAYEADLAIRAYVVPVGVGDPLPEMPLFLAPRACVEVPLEPTYRSAFGAFPRRWRHLLET